MGEKEKQQIVAEVNILRELRHANIVKYYDRIIDKNKAKIYIVMEYCENGDMAKLVKNCKRKKDHMVEEVVWKILSQMVYALYECHTRKGGKILHRDLKPGNVFLDKNNNVKIGDFGLSRVMGQESIYAYTRVGTPYYMSPEQINAKKYNDRSDVWSLGCVIYEIAALRPPFTADNQLALAMKIKSGKIEDLPEQYSSDLQKIIKKMLNLDQKKRPSVEDLIVIPQISLRLRERQVKDYYNSLKRREEEIKKKTKDLDTRATELNTKEKELEDKAKQLEAKEKELEEMKEELRTMKNSLRSSTNPISLTGSDNKENVSMNTTYNNGRIDESISNLRNEFSEKKRNYNTNDLVKESLTSLTRGSTTA